MSWALFKATTKANYKLIGIIVTVLLFYMVMMVFMYNPASQQAMELYIQSLPAELIKAMNFEMVDGSLTGFIAGYFYGFLVIMFPMVMIILVTYKVMAKLVDRGSMALILSTPNTRFTVAFTQALFVLFAVTITFLSVFAFGLLYTQAIHPNEIDLQKFFLINLGAWSYFVAIGGIAFFASTFFNEGRHAMTAIVSVPLFFLIVQMLHQISDQFEWLRYLTLLTLYQPNDIMLNQPVLLSFVVLIGIGFLFFSIAILHFTKKDLAI